MSEIREWRLTRYEVRRGAAWITLNSPANRNALSEWLVAELLDRLLEAMNDSAVRSRLPRRSSWSARWRDSPFKTALHTRPKRSPSSSPRTKQARESRPFSRSVTQPGSAARKRRGRARTRLLALRRRCSRVPPGRFPEFSPASLELSRRRWRLRLARRT